MTEKTTAAWTPFQQAVFDWAGTLHQPIYVLRTMSQRTSRSADWSKLTTHLRKQGFMVNDRALKAAISATLLRLKAEQAAQEPEPPVITEDDANADWLVTLQHRPGHTPDSELVY